MTLSCYSEKVMLLESTYLSTSQRESHQNVELLWVLWEYFRIFPKFLPYYLTIHPTSKKKMKGFLGRVSYWWGGYGWDGRVNPGEVQSTAVSGDTPVPWMQNPTGWMAWRGHQSVGSKMSCLAPQNHGFPKAKFYTYSLIQPKIIDEILLHIHHQE